MIPEDEIKDGTPESGTPPASDSPPAGGTPPASGTPPSTDTPSLDELAAAAKAAKELVGSPTTAQLSDLTADVTLAEKGLAQLENLSFGKIIGAPLTACFEAQVNTAKASLQYIKDMGLKDDKDGKSQIVLVAFEFWQSGKKMKMQIPLLTLVPIPSIAIDTIEYSFMIKIDTASSVKLTSGTTDTFSTTYGIGEQPKPAAEGGGEPKPSGKDNKEGKANATEKPSTQVSFSASLSSKKESTATKESKYSVETTMDIKVTAKQGKDMPAGVARMLDILNNSIEVIDPNGVLDVSPEQVKLENGKAIVFASYIDGDGVCLPASIKCTPAAENITVDGDRARIAFNKAGSFVISAGKRNKEVVVTEKEKETVVTE